MADPKASWLDFLNDTLGEGWDRVSTAASFIPEVAGTLANQSIEELTGRPLMGESLSPLAPVNAGVSDGEMQKAAVKHAESASDLNRRRISALSAQEALLNERLNTLRGQSKAKDVFAAIGSKDSSTPDMVSGIKEAIPGRTLGQGSFSRSNKPISSMAGGDFGDRELADLGISPTGIKLISMFRQAKTPGQVKSLEAISEMIPKDKQAKLQDFLSQALKSPNKNSKSILLAQLRGSLFSDDFIKTLFKDLDSKK